MSAGSGGSGDDTGVMRCFPLNAEESGVLACGNPPLDGAGDRPFVGSGDEAEAMRCLLAIAEKSDVKGVSIGVK